MSRKAVQVTGVLAAIVLLGAVTSAMAGEAEELAVEAAEAWLAKIDQGEYAESWEEAAKFFKNAVPLEQWKSSLKAAREPLGQVVSREVRSTQYATELPGAPDGEYVVIQFATSFEKKKSAIETVTPMMDEDGEWRVSGYYIK